MAQAASALMPLTVLQAASALQNANTIRRVPTQTVGGPIHHQAQVGRFRYSPIGGSVASATPTLAANPIVGSIPTADFLTTSALLQMQMSQQQLAALQQAAVAQTGVATVAGGVLPSTAQTVGSNPGKYSTIHNQLSILRDLCIQSRARNRRSNTVAAIRTLWHPVCQGG